MFEGLPRLGTWFGGVSKADAAREMVKPILEYDPSFTVYLIGFGVELREEFQRWLAKLRQGTR